MRKIHESSQMEVFSLDFEGIDTVEVPLYIKSVQAGFPSPADDYVELSLDLLKYLVDKPHTTFCVRVKGNSMEAAMIVDGSLLVVDRSRTVKNNGIIIAVLNGDFTVKRFKKTKGKSALYPHIPPTTRCWSFLTWTFKCGAW